LIRSGCCRQEKNPYYESNPGAAAPVASHYAELLSRFMKYVHKSP